MANYDFKENPTYQTQIRAWSNNDPVNAEIVLNPVLETVINNTHTVKLSADQHKNDRDKHITATEREKLSVIEEGANKYVHPNSGTTAGTYRSVTVNASGHVTTGSNPTTVSGYGLADVYTKIEVDTKINAHKDSISSHVSTTDRTNWNDSNSKKHEHNNKSVLDGITSTKVSNWDSASTNSHTHSNKAALDSVSQTKVNTWDGYNQKITELNTALNNLMSAITAGISANTTLTNENITPLKLNNELYKIGKGFSLSNNSIKIEEDMEYIQVSASCYFYTGTTGTSIKKNLRITNNGNAIGFARIAYATQYLTAVIPSRVVRAQKGDIIQLSVEGVSGDVISNTNPATYLSITKIK